MTLRPSLLGDLGRLVRALAVDHHHLVHAGFPSAAHGLGYRGLLVEGGDHSGDRETHPLPIVAGSRPGVYWACR